MIDTATESLLSLAQAAHGLPRRRRGRKTHVSTLYRWTATGCRGVLLEYVQVGSTRCTSREALQRFFGRLTGTPLPPPSPRSTSASRRSAERADRELARLGL